MTQNDAGEIGGGDPWEIGKRGRFVFRLRVSSNGQKVGLIGSGRRDGGRTP